MVFRIASSPYTHNQRQTSRIMLLVVLATLPGIAAQLWFFGWGTLLQIILACGSALAAEALVLRLRKQQIGAILGDNSALLTGLLLAVSVPPFTPWWMVVLGTVFAVIIAKQLYGGLGHNPFNPAMIGYVVLLISFPVQMTSWLPPFEIAKTVPGLMDAVQIIFTGHAATGHTMDSLRMGLMASARQHPWIPLKHRFMPGIRSMRSSNRPFTAACWRVQAGSGSIWGICWAVSSCCGRKPFAGISR